MLVEPELLPGSPPEVEDKGDGYSEIATTGKKLKAAVEESKTCEG